MNQIYLDTARLLTQVAPIVMESGVFALKGGTAINLFIRDMPRLSVDLDLVFSNYRLPRDQALARINEAILQSGRAPEDPRLSDSHRDGDRRRRNQIARTSWRHRNQGRSQLRHAGHRPVGPHRVAVAHGP